MVTQWSGISLLLVWLFVSTGCSLKSIVIPNLGWLVTKKINDGLDLKSQDKKKLKKDVLKLLEVLKPQIKEIQNDFGSMELSAVNIKEINQRVRQDYEKAQQMVVPVYVKYLSNLNSKQLEHFREENIEQNQKIEKSLKKINDKAINRFESFFDDLTEEQKKLVEKNQQVFFELTRRRLQQRVMFQEELYNLFSENDIVQRREEMKTLFYAYSKNFKEDSLRKKSLQVVDEVIQRSSQKQRKYFRKKIKKYDSWITAYLKHKFI